MANTNQKTEKGLAEKEIMKKYIEELIQNILKIEEEKGKALSKNKISALKNMIARKYTLSKPPRDVDIMLSATKEQRDKLKHLKSKPTRSLSGVAVVAVMTKPMKCPHGKCVFCPGGVASEFGDTPQSYTGYEPSTRRARRNNFDPFMIVFNRLEQYVLSGHNPNKVDCIIMGGTFPSYDEVYQYEVVIEIYAAMNAFSTLFYQDQEIDFDSFKKWFYLPHDTEDENLGAKILKKIKDFKENYMKVLNEQYSDYKDRLTYVKKENEHSAIRCIGLTQETRPDYGLLEHANMMLTLGTTRVEIGVQSVFNDILKKSGRGHSVEDTIISTKILKDLGFKINYHMMIGMPGSDEEKDQASFQKIFSDADFKPDMLKIYPCLVMKGTKLYDDYLQGLYTPYTFEKAIEILAKIVSEVPEYCRIMRIQRDIPSTMIEDGIKKTNLKEYIDQYMKEKKLTCRDIRSREISRIKKTLLKKPDYKINVKKYDASGGEEFFITAEDDANDLLIGFCRLRFIHEVLREEFTERSAIIRELHVYGAALNLGEQNEISLQHKGWGKKLVHKAEEICKEYGKDKLLVISGVGVKEYYRKLGYSDDGPYVSKLLR